MILYFLFVILYGGAVFVTFLMVAKTLGSIQNLLARLENLLVQEMELLRKKEQIRKALFESPEPPPEPEAEPSLPPAK